MIALNTMFTALDVTIPDILFSSSPIDDMKSFLQKDNYQPIDDYFEKRNLSLFYSCVRINISSHHQEVDIYLLVNPTISYKRKKLMLKNLISFIKKTDPKLLASLKCSFDQHKDLNIQINEEGFSIGIHHELLNTTIRVSYKLNGPY